MQRRVVIFGGDGNLGTELARVFTLAGDIVTTLSREQCDITKAESVEQVLADSGANLVINAAAYNNVDGAESEPAATVAMQVNAYAPGYIAASSKNIGARFIHISSDYVFSGDDQGGYTEDAAPSPVSKYGETKAKGDELVRATHPEAWIVRTSRLFGRQGASPDCKPSFVTLISSRALTKPSLTLVDEEVACPTYTADLAVAICELVDKAYPPGTYHLVNEDDGVTWFGFAQEIFEILGLNPVVTKVDSATFQRPARRPGHVVLRNTRGPKLPSRKDALKRFLLGPLKGGMTIEQTGIPGLFVFTPVRFGDERGWFSEVLNVELLRSLGLPANIIQVNEGQSPAGVLRGLHFQKPPFAQEKIVSCTAGVIYDVAVDIRKESPTYGKHFAVELSAENGKALYIPKGFAHGLMSLKDGSRIRYHVLSNGWEKQAEDGLRYNDPGLGVNWPSIDGEVLVNARDQSWPLFEDLETPFTEHI